MKCGVVGEIKCCVRGVVLWVKYGRVGCGVLGEM